MTHPTDLPGAVPIAIATALVGLIVAPWLGGTDAEACAGTHAEAPISVVDRASTAAASTVEPAAEGDCD